MFSAVGAVPDVKPQKDGTIIITVAATPEVLDAFGNEGIVVLSRPNRTRHPKARRSEALKW
jgi:hypothetical protein